MKFCANLFYMFPEDKTMAERYALAKKAGFRAVESRFPIGYTINEIKQAKDTTGLQIIMMNLKTGDISKGELGVAAIPGQEFLFKETLRETIEYAIALNVKVVHVLAGKVNEVTPKNWETYENNLKYAARELGKAKLVGVIEPVSHSCWPYYFLNDFNNAVEIIQRIDSPYLRLLLDIYHLQNIHGNLFRNIKSFLLYAGHVQIAQVPNRNEPDTAGEINYQNVLRLLEDCGYEGWVGLEYIPKGTLEDSLKWIKNYGYSL